MAELKLKKYVVYFVSGGWDKVWAKTKRHAIKETLQRYPKYSKRYHITRVELATDDIH